MKTLMLLGLCGCCFAQQPRIQNAKLQTREASSGLTGIFGGIVQSQAEPAWVGYSVPRAAHHDSSEWGCSLEDGRNAVVVRDANTPVPLEGPVTILVLFRIEEKRVQRVRTMSPDCLLDAGGLPFYWLNNTRPAETVSLLESLVKDNSHNGLVYAIAATKDPASDAALRRLVGPSQPENVRRSAIQWLMDAPGGVPEVIRLAREDKDAKLRRAAVNALARSKDAQAKKFFEETLLR